MTALSDFPKLLQHFVDIDRSGHASFCYPGAYGAMKAITDHVRNKLREADAAKGAKRQRELLKEALAYIEGCVEEHREIDRLWHEHLHRKEPS